MKKTEALMHAEDLAEALLDMTMQACWNNEDEEFDSMCLSSCAHALRLLAKLDMVEIKSEYGRRVIAKLKGENKDEETCNSVCATDGGGLPENAEPATVPTALRVPTAAKGTPDRCQGYAIDVKRVIDGDTIVVSFSVWPDITLQKTIRFADIDTWEVRGKNREKGLAATAALEKLLKMGQPILYTEGKTGKYGRTIGMIYIDVKGVAVSVSEKLTAGGHEKVK